MRVSAKICGITTPEALDAALKGGASHVGFVFFPPSPRHLSFDRARALAARVPDHVGKVGVFVDPDNALVEAAREAAGLRHLQLHGTEFTRIAELNARPGNSIWAAVPVRRASDLDEGARYAAIPVDRILYDAKTPDGALLPGGMGLRFDWEMLRGYRHPCDWALAGGLTPENVAPAIQVTGARMVDVSSGVESAPGVKDVDKIAAFLKAVALS
ncbi:phosphoribosylanthranilate isomerase [Sphingomonas sp.]|uniref:phosphoribosylanthranilate isomerase n=1 Tax=Sphingomonas sp. TaxID=28214 RepID=UPI001B280C3C|nr:phosphoribosylanthranilate isomerase [Sphingomonas sp.]MBO9711865.1 phosphoribosylanthranilate isomerase [Sphingomonas sp.]